MTKNKSRGIFLAFSLFIAVLLLPASLRGESPLITINDRIHVLFTSNTQFLYYDNLFYEESSGQDETMFIFTSGIELNIGRPENKASIVFNVSREFKEYTENSDLDTHNDFAQIKGHYKSPILKTEASLSFKETDDLTSDLAEEISEGILVKRDLVRFQSYAEYELSLKTSLSTGLNFSRKRYISDTFPTLRDQSIISLPIDFYYELTPKIDLSLGYRYRQTNVDRNGEAADESINRDSEDNFFNVGLRGSLTPKLDGKIQAGFQDRDLKNNDDTNNFSFISDLTWKATQKTQLHLQFIRDFDTGGQGDSIEKTSLSLDLDYLYSPKWKGIIFFEYEFSDYNNSISREDDFTQAGLGLDYLINRHTSLSGAFFYQNNDSDDNSSTIDNSFDNTVLSLSLSFRY